MGGNILEQRLKFYVNIIQDSGMSILKNPVYFFLTILFDFLFVFIFAMIYSYIAVFILNKIISLFQLLGTETGGLTNILTPEDATKLSVIANNPEFVELFGSIMKDVFIMMLAFLICFIIFQVFAWRFSIKAATKNNKLTPIEPEYELTLLQYWKNFALQSLPFLILTFGWSFFCLRSYILSKLSPAVLLPAPLWKYFLVLGLIIIWYFGNISFCFLKRKSFKNFVNSFIIGIKKFPQIIPSIIFLGVLALVIELVLRIPLLVQSVTGFFIIGVILVFSYLVFARIVIFKTVQLVFPKHKKPRMRARIKSVKKKS
ncbi:hypothetical protein HN587_03690 [Candidatus Woesearchaeota archaeon]|jgi:hypothetical protein|nr:hypothetical protein [Candidatus Woesearchaeota archaeon]